MTIHFEWYIELNLNKRRLIETKRDSKGRFVSEIKYVWVMKSVKKDNQAIYTAVENDTIMSWKNRYYEES